MRILDLFPSFGSALAEFLEGSHQADGSLRPDELQPSDMGLVAWTFDPEESVQLSTHGTGNIHAAAVRLRKGQVISKMGMYIGVAAVSPTHFKIGIYDKDFNLVAATADTPNALLSTGYVEVDLTTPFVVPEDDLYYFADLAAASTMATVLTRTTVTQSARSLLPNAPHYRAFNPGGSYTDFPDPITPATSGAFNFVYAR